MRSGIIIGSAKLIGRALIPALCKGFSGGIANRRVVGVNDV